MSEQSSEFREFKRLRKMTPSQLEKEADKFLSSELKSVRKGAQNGILSWSQLRLRRSREVYSTRGYVDPSVCLGSFKRAYSGRKMRTSCNQCLWQKSNRPCPSSCPKVVD